MSENTNIEWTDHTFNPWIGCTKVSPGCLNCYAETLDNNRFSKTLGEGTKVAPVSHWGKGSPRHRTSESNWKQPLKWNRQYQLALDTYKTAIEAGAFMNYPERPRVFCASLADWLDDEVPLQWLVDLLHLIAVTPNLDWQLLTKRPENWESRMEACIAFSALATAWIEGSPPPNVLIGATVECRSVYNRIPHLIKIPAKVRFLSCEPLLEEIVIKNGIQDARGGFLIEDGIHWIICGGESGSGHRPFNPDWARSLRDQCHSAGVAFFMKQMGGDRKPFPPIPGDLMIRQFPKAGGVA